MKCYKLLKCDKYTGRLYSVGNLPDRWIITYSTSKIMYPVENSKLFVFDTQKNAESYRVDCGSSGWGYSYEVWECEGTDIAPCTDYAQSIDGINTFWYKKRRTSCSPARGAQFASMVKLIRRIS